jgi:adenylosuccinate lyase
MEQNVEASRGLHFSEKVLTALVESGMSRPEAYTLVQRAAMQSWRTGEPFRMVLEEDSEVTSRLSPADLESLFDVSSFLRYIDTAFARLGLLSSQSSLPSDQPP